MTPRERYRQVARLHIENLDQGFLATLGEGFLALMYEAINHAEGVILLTDEADGQVRGFVTGGSGMGPIYRRMLRRPVRLAVALAPALLSIAVDAAWRGTGVAERLYTQLVAEFRSRGVESFRIIVGDALAPAHRFYRRMGAQPIGEVEVHKGERSTVYVQRADRMVTGCSGT